MRTGECKGIEERKIDEAASGASCNENVSSIRVALSRLRAKRDGRSREPFSLAGVRACVRVCLRSALRTLRFYSSGAGEGTGSKIALLALRLRRREFPSRDSRVNGRNLAVTSDKASHGVVRRLLRPGGGGGGGGDGGDGGGSGGSSTRGYVAAASMTLL